MDAASIPMRKPEQYDDCVCGHVKDAHRRQQPCLIHGCTCVEFTRAKSLKELES